MRWKRARRSDNVVDARSSSSRMGGGKRLTLGGVAIVVIIGLLSGQDPMQILGQLAGQALQGGSVSAPQQTPAGNDEQADFVRAVLGDTEDTWRDIFQGANRQYKDPTLVLFRGGVNSACGFANSAVGPFYCPGDQRVYIDLAFFRELEQRFGAAGDFAQAYVIAHEVGHHVQTLLGVSAKVNAARQRGELNAANAIGDDRLQKQARGQVVPDSFTHGTSEQRVRWFKTGFAAGDISRCDTFKATRL